ncbi:MAG: hypothetical protein R3F37_14330 [Candidatus Competibacteraceae bacterium]
MNKIAYVSTVSSLSAAILLAPSLAGAANFAFQPRLEGGFCIMTSNHKQGLLPAGRYSPMATY